MSTVVDMMTGLVIYIGLFAINVFLVSYDIEKQY